MHIRISYGSILSGHYCLLYRNICMNLEYCLWGVTVAFLITFRKFHQAISNPPVSSNRS